VSLDSNAAADLFARPLPAPAPRRRRPAAIAVAALVLAAFACLELLSMASLFIGSGVPPPLGGPLRGLFDHIVPISIVRASIDALALAAAFAVWNGWRWGRVTAIVVSACWAVVFAAFGVVFAFSLPDGMAANLPAAFVGMWRGAAITTGLFWGACLSTPGVILTRRSASAWFDATA
jgi:hypothetical protein